MAILEKIIGKIVPPRQLQAKQIIVITTFPKPIKSKMKKFIVSAWRVNDSNVCSPEKRK